MSATEEAPRSADVLPTFDLEFGFDDPDEPQSVTVFDPDASDVSTTWVTIDADHAIPLEDVA